MSDSVLAIVKEQPDIKKVKLIGSGDFASVYRIKQLTAEGEKTCVVRVTRDIRNHYAIKREKDLLNYLNQFPEFARFNEIRKVGYYYLQFFDYVGKRNLKQCIKKEGVLSDKANKRLLKNMVSILERAGSVGFAHGNIQPDNIVCGDKNYHLVDWSLSIPSLSSFDSESLKGDLSYFPPERLNGQLDEKSDVYLLGCTLYYSITGKHIYRLKSKDEPEKQMWAHAHHTVHKMNKLPIFWRYLIFWMTQKDPAKRPGLVELKTWLKDSTVPDWVRQMSVRAEKTYPEEPLTILADEHFLFPIYKKALECEESGDIETAFNLYENCVFRDYSRAENRLGLMYERGQPVSQSYAMAANMYHQAFEKGNPLAAYNLARLFEQGLGMPVNLKYAFKLYRYAAMRGHLDAQNALAMMYMDGRGVKANMAQARSWLGMAARYGCEDAKSNIKKLLKQSKKPV